MKSSGTTLILVCIIAALAAPAGLRNIPVQTKVCDISVNGNAYIITPELTLESYNLRNDSLKKLSVSNLGFDPLIDATNPLEIFIFFPSAGKLVVFDNQLNVQQQTQLFQFENFNPGAFGRSNDGNIWLFDLYRKNLKKLNRFGEKMAESVIVQAFVAGDAIIRINDNGQHIWLEDAEHTVFVFDQNLRFQGQINAEDGLIGYGTDVIYLKRGNAVLQRNTTLTGMQRSDTVYVSADTLIPMRVYKDYLLESHKRGLILRSR